jgi:hypothetical protein
MRAVPNNFVAPARVADGPVPALVRFAREDAQRFVEDMRKLHKQLNEELTFIQNRRQEKDTTMEALAFKPRDHVWLSTRNLTNRLRPAKKLNSKRIGPFQIAEAILAKAPRAYRLHLPSSFRLSTNTFHVSLLTPAATDPLPN